MSQGPDFMLDVSRQDFQFFPSFFWQFALLRFVIVELRALDQLKVNYFSEIPAHTQQCRHRESVTDYYRFQHLSVV